MVITVKQKLLGFLQKYRTNLFIIAVLFLFFIILFRDGLFGGKYVIVGDPFRQLYPLRMIAWNMIKEGSLPLWTPLLFSGYPLFSMVMLGIGYPLTWGYMFLPGYWAEQIYVLAPYLLSSIFTYAFLRELGRGHIASLLGGLVYGYSGFLLSPIGLTGVHANSALWLPLVLMGIERAQRRPFIPCLLLTTGAYTMSVLAGSGQIFVYIALLAVAYGIFLGIFPNVENESETPGRYSWRRWRSLAVISGAMLLSAGLAAYQILETWNSVRLSVRRAYPYSYFTEGSFSFKLAWRSFLEPLANYWDSSTFAPLIAALLAVVAIISASLRPRFWPKIIFWAIVAVIAGLLILGNNTPLFQLYIKIPFVSRFRYPSRHTMEWTFAIGVLAAYGWDVLETRLSRMAGIARTERPFSFWPVLAGCVFLLIGGVMSYYWRLYTVESGLEQITDINNAMKNLHYPYIGWKFGFTLSIIIALTLFYRVINSSARIGLLAVTIAFYCFVEPFIWMIKPVTNHFGVIAEQFDGSVGESTKFLLSQPGEKSRNFTLIHPYEIEIFQGRPADPVNWTTLAGIQDLNGYESLIMERYSVALNNLPWGTVNADPFITMKHALLESKNHVLDLLNARFITSFSNLASIQGAGPIEKDGIVYYPVDLMADLKQDNALSLPGENAEADTLALVSTMAFSNHIENETPVAKISIHTSDGRVIERNLRAGRDTSEWAHERADVRATVRHSLAPIFDSAQGDTQNSFRSHRYLARFDLGERLKAERIDVVKLIDSVSVELWKASLFDSVTRRSSPLQRLKPDRWKKVFDKNGITILENLSVLPRAWLVSKAEALDKVEILNRIRGESKTKFDPRSEALVEIEPHKIPALSGEPLSADSYARIITYEPRRIIIETNSDKQAMLVVSEMHHPGWVATLDGVKTSIHQTDFLLRGFFVPEGKHTVEMVYKAPGARNGAIISLATLALIGALVFYGRRKQALSK